MNIWIVIREMNWASRLGLLVVSGFGFCAIFAPWLAPYGQSEIVGDVWEPLFGEFFFGTDQIGRDMLSMLIYGARNMIALALLTTACAFGLGSLMGFLAATVGGWVDQVLSRFVDVVISIPTLIFALIVLSSTGTSILALVTVIAIIYAMPVYRIARAVAMDIEVMDYVEAARLRGEGLWWIMRREILPNALTPLADWGAMVRDNGGGIAWGFMHPLVPATCIALLTIGINLIVDSAVQKASGLREDH